MRDVLLARLKTDLIGPFTENEVLTARPSDVYLTGILWPREARMDAEQDERLDISGADESETAGAGQEEEVSLAGLMRPCSAGVSFAARAGARGASLDLTVRFATYEPVESAVAFDESGNTGGGRGGVGKGWRRHAFDIRVEGVMLDDAPRWIGLEDWGAPAGVRLHLRTVPWSDGALATVTLLNYAAPDEDEGRDGMERLTLFQVGLEIRPAQGTRLVARPSRRAVLDEDDRSAELLYRNAHEFATGHTCSVEWETGGDPGSAVMVATSWIPTATVPATSASGHEVFGALREHAEYKPLSPRWLARAEAKALGPSPPGTAGSLWTMD